MTDITAERPVLNLLVAPGAPVLPRGRSTLGGMRIDNFDVSLPDAFARGGGTFAQYGPIATDCCGPGLGFDAAAAVRNALQDPRLPALTSSTAAAGDFFALFNPAWTFLAPGWWNLFGKVAGLKPNTTYTVVLARMALDVRGAPDQEQRLTGYPVTDPDSLYFLGGTPAAPAVDVVCDFSTGIGVSTARNPVALGTVTSDAAGAATVDCLPVAFDDSPWWRSVDAQFPPGAEDSLPVGQNETAGRVLPGQYNYVLLYEGAYVAGSGDPTPAARPTLRAQLGPDIDAAGTAIANAFAPFPAGVTNTATFRQLPGGAGAFAVPSRITLNVSGLPALAASAAYQVFLHNALSGEFAAVPVQVRVGADAMSPASATFASPGEQHAITLQLDASTEVDFGAFHSVVIAISSASGDPSPVTPGFLFSEYLSADRALAAGALGFGAFDPAGAHRAFRVAGSGGASFIGDSLIVQVAGLLPPPGGFHYQSYLAWNPGGLLDLAVRLHRLEPDALGSIRDAVAESEVPSGFRAFTTWVILLEPDASPGFNAAVIQASEDYREKFPAYFE